ncbi:MAG: hypothetical protein KDA42_06035, partial [Planctomycetales bacterium]|nr:hypothetical protein [Planctomycetales bacterium]
MRTSRSRDIAHAIVCGAALCCLATVSGCGTTRQNSATEQLLLSDAVDRSVARIDFAPLTGKKVYLDTQYVQPVKQGGFV